MFDGREVKPVNRFDGTFVKVLVKLSGIERFGVTFDEESDFAQLTLVGIQAVGCIGPA